MARVIKEVPVKEKQAVCEDGCGATVAYVPNEVKERHGTDYGGGPDGSKWVVCPGCGAKIVLESW